MRSALLLTALVAAGCSAPVTDAADEPELRPMQASVAVERVQSGAALRTRVSARFVRARGGMDFAAAERLVGSPSRFGAGARGCALVDERGAQGLPHADPLGGGQGMGRSRGQKGGVELVDVGDIVMHVGALSMPLAQRAFPDVGDLVSGVVYTSRDDSIDLPVGARYSFETHAGSSADASSLAFHAQVDAPSALGGVTVAGAAIGSLDSIAADAPLAIGWEPSASTRDRVVVDVASGAGKLLRCAFEDRGSASIAPGQLAALPVGDVEISVHRVRRESVGGGGALQGALIDFDFAVAAHAVLTD